MVRVAVWDYQGKGRIYAQALEADTRFGLVDDIFDAQVGQAAKVRADVAN